MAPRRSHRKSRSGCQTCKRRRVKCPEGGPPCANCLARQILCDYPSASSQPQHDLSTTITPDSTEVNADPSFQRSDIPGHHQQQLLELELMHRWSTATYKTVSTPVVDDYFVWQTIVPRIAFSYDFLLNGLLAVSAFETAHSLGPTGSARYISAALEFQGRAFRSYQAQLQNMKPESHQALLYFSILLVVLAFAMPPLASGGGEFDSKVQRVLGHFELICGIGVIGMTEDRIRNDPLFKNIKTMNELPRTPLDPSTVTVIASLNLMNDARSAASSEESSDIRFRRLQNQGACKKALFWLEECFVTCHNNLYRSWALGWIVMPGSDYIKAIKESDQVALLILMCWGVLMEPLGNDHCTQRRSEDYGNRWVGSAASTLKPLYAMGDGKHMAGEHERLVFQSTMPKAAASHHMSPDVNVKMPRAVASSGIFLAGSKSPILALPFLVLHVIQQAAVLLNKILTMAADSIVEAPTSVDPQPKSPLLDMPTETRQLILEHASPFNDRLILNPEPRPSSLSSRPSRPSYGSAAALLRVSKQIYQEVVPLLYSRNIPTIMNPTAYGVLDHHIPNEFLISIKKLQVCIDHKRCELGGIWDSLVRVLPSTNELVLDLCRCSELLKPLGELMWRAQKDQTFTLKFDVPDYAGLNAKNLFLNITKQRIEAALEWGCMQALMYDLRSVPQLKTITVKVALLPKVTQVFEHYQNNRLHWRFSKDRNRDTNTARYLVWEKVTTT